MIQAAKNHAPSAQRASQSSVAAKAALRIAEQWHVNDRDLSILLGGVSVPTIQRWRRQLRDGRGIRSELNRDQLDRVSYLLGIYKALHILFPQDAQADSWIHRPVDMPGFDGRPALDLMRNGGMMDLRNVRRFLDGWRG